MVCRRTLLFLATAVIALFQAGLAQEGWRMIDRFYGFRYELSSPPTFGDDFENRVVQFAESKACFGWIQKTTDDRRVSISMCTR